MQLQHTQKEEILVVPTSVNLQLHTFNSPGYQSIVDQAIEFFGKTPVHSLPPPVNFSGVGVYAIYYLGNFKHYRHLVSANREQCHLQIWGALLISVIGDFHAVPV